MEKLRDVCDKKDRTIQTNKMIIKFRDNTIKRLEEKLKGADVLDTEKVEQTETTEKKSGINSFNI